MRHTGPKPGKGITAPLLRPNPKAAGDSRLRRPQVGFNLKLVVLEA